MGRAGGAYAATATLRDPALMAAHALNRIDPTNHVTVNGSNPHQVTLEIDPQTGFIDVVVYSSVNDVGRVVNPMIVRGQLEGGAVQGLGQALCEHVRYDRETGQLVTGSLMDYCAPHSDIAKNFKTEMDQSTPCKNNRLGVKGVGELGTIGATPSVMNAIADALARNGMAAKSPLLQMPVTAPKLWELMQA